MKHYGDITKLNGAYVPPVNVITGGSPCQDLSVAGKRAGLSGERSGLFMEQIRLIREMRENDRKKGRTDKSIRPRYMVWENVPGAFSSNGGEDFRAVLEETARTADKDAVIPRLEKGQKWSSSGCILGDGWSIAWRVHDAQFWGVPQRRKRIALVADFGGATAPEILFERKGLSGDIEESRKERQGTATDAEESVGETGQVGRCLSAAGGGLNEHTPVVCIEGNGSRPSHNGDGYAESETMYTMNATERHAVCVENHPNDSRVKISEDGKVQTLSGRMGTGGGNVPMVMEDAVISFGNGQLHDAMPPSVDVAKTLNCMDDPAKIVTYGLDRASFNQGANAKYDFSIEEEKIGAQVARGPGTVCQSVVRRLTPLECERLQGFPDGWTDIGDWIDSKGKKHKDSDAPRYKALGNSIALPFWEWMAKRMAAYLPENSTMASLFDGIGGFPLVYSRAGVSPIWASEIEEFPIAVTKRHFKEEI